MSEICEKHRKFAAYWEGLGNPALEVKYSTDDFFNQLAEYPTKWIEGRDYRIAGDRHWKLRKKWVDSDFTLLIELSSSEPPNFSISTRNPNWNQEHDYREAPQQQEPIHGDLSQETKSALKEQVGGSHYKACKIQPVEFIVANGLGFLEGNVIKYVTRHKIKGGRADLEKARHYIDLLLELEYKQ